MERREREEGWKEQYREQERRKEMGEKKWGQQQAEMRRLAINNLFK